MNLMISLALAVAASVPFASTWAADPLQPGLYEVTTQLEFPKGAPAPGKPLKDSVVQQCVRPADLRSANPLGEVFKQPGCKVLESKIKGTQLQWKVTCHSGLATGQGTAKLEGNRFQGEGATQAKLRGGPAFQIKFKYAGRRIKDC